MKTLSISGKGSIKKVVEDRSCREFECAHNLKGRCTKAVKPKISSKDNTCMEFE